MINHTEFEKLKVHIEYVCNRETDIEEQREFTVIREENDAITILLNPMELDLEPDEEDQLNPEDYPQEGDNGTNDNWRLPAP
jgi:hypothetical protein